MLVSAQGGGTGIESTQILTLPRGHRNGISATAALAGFHGGRRASAARRGHRVRPVPADGGGGASVGGFDVNAGGLGVNVGQPSAFTFLPALGAVPVGLDLNTGYELADLKLQWLICDFGRRMGRYRQAGLATDIAQLQSERAYQTVANEVSVAYYQVLRTRALRKTALDAVRRAEDDLQVAKNLKKAGVLEKEKVLRVEVLLAESQRLLDAVGKRGSGGGRRTQSRHRLERQCSHRRSGNLGRPRFHAVPGRMFANSGRSAARIPGGTPIHRSRGRRAARCQGQLCASYRCRGGSA